MFLIDAATLFPWEKNEKKKKELESMTRRFLHQVYITRILNLNLPFDFCIQYFISAS